MRPGRMILAFVCVVLLSQNIETRGQENPEEPNGCNLTDLLEELNLDHRYATKELIEYMFLSGDRGKNGTSPAKILAAKRAIAVLSEARQSMPLEGEPEPVNIGIWLPRSTTRLVDYIVHARDERCGYIREGIIKGGVAYFGQLPELYQEVFRSKFSVQERALVAFDYLTLKNDPPDPGMEVAYFNFIYRSVLSDDDGTTYDGWTKSELFILGFVLRLHGQTLDEHLGFRHPFLWRFQDSSYYFSNKISFEVSSSFSTAYFWKMEKVEGRNIPSATWIHFLVAVGLENKPMIEVIGSEKFRTLWKVLHGQPYYGGLRFIDAFFKYLEFVKLHQKPVMKAVDGVVKVCAGLLGKGDDWAAVRYRQ